MKKFNMFFLVFLIMLSFSTFVYAEVIAKIDNIEITEKVLKDYVDKNLGKRYENYLKTEAGKKKLAEYYIDRFLLLQLAKKEYSKKDISKLKNSHLDIDDDTLYLLHLINEKINKTIKVTKEDLNDFKKANGIKNDNVAYSKLLTIRRKEKLDSLLKELKSQHDIEFFSN